MSVNSKKSFFLISSLLVLLFLQGCAAPSVKLSAKDRVDLKKLKSVKVFHRRAGWPTLKTPLGVLASDLTFGMSEDWSEGQKLVKKFKIKDPGETIKLDFIKQLRRKKAANFVSVRAPLGYDASDTENMKKKYKKGVVLKIMPNMWQIWYYPFNWARYQMWFGVTAELVRLDDSKVLWSSSCRADQDNSDTAPTLDEITANNSNVLKKWVSNSSKRCSRQFVNDFMGITAKKQ